MLNFCVILKNLLHLYIIKMNTKGTLYVVPILKTNILINLSLYLIIICIINFVIIENRYTEFMTNLLSI